MVGILFVQNKTVQGLPNKVKNTLLFHLMGLLSSKSIKMRMSLRSTPPTLIKKLTDINRCLTDPANRCLTDV